MGSARPRKKKKNAGHVVEETCGESTANAGSGNCKVPNQILDDSGDEIAPDCFQMELPSLLTPVMCDYIKSTGLTDLFHSCITTPCRSFTNSVVQCRMKWLVRRIPLPEKSNIYWISPADDGTNSNLLEHLKKWGTSGSAS